VRLSGQYAFQYPNSNFITGEGKYTPVERDHEGNAQPLKPHRWAVFILTKDGTGRYAKGFHDKGKRVGYRQPVEQALIFIAPVDGIEHQAVEDEE